MRKDKSCCPWCGAHFTQKEKRSLLKQGASSCPVCSNQIYARHSGRRMLTAGLLAVGLCAADFALLLLELPLVLIWCITAVCVAVLWCLRGCTVIFSTQSN